MKIIQLISIGFLFFACAKQIVPTMDANKADFICNENPSKGNSLARENPRGKVSSYKSTVHKALTKSGKIFYETNLKRNAVHETCLFDNSGNVREVLGNYLYESSVQINDQLIKTTYKFNNKGEKIEEATYKVEGTKFLLLRKKTSLYDTTGSLLEVNEYEKNEMKGKTVRKIDMEKRAVVEYYYGADGTLGSGIISLKYDDRGNELERIGSNLQTKKVNSTEIKNYDLTNNQIGYRYDGPIGKFECVFKYDEKNNLVDKICTSSSKTRHDHYDYVYDKHCNWIQRIETTDNILGNVTIRVFEYR